MLIYYQHNLSSIWRLTTLLSYMGAYSQVNPNLQISFSFSWKRHTIRIDKLTIIWFLDKFQDKLENHSMMLDLLVFYPLQSFDTIRDDQCLSRQAKHSARWSVLRNCHYIRNHFGLAVFNCFLMVINQIPDKCLFDVPKSRELLYNANEVKYYLRPTGQLSKWVTSLCFRWPNLLMNIHTNFNFSDTCSHAPESKPWSTCILSFLFLR